MKGLAKEFKEFITRGNVMSMAVGIIIGGAFTAIVTSLVNDIITPVIGMAIGGLDFTAMCVTVGSANIMYGNFIQAIIIFLLTALVLFFIMKGANALLNMKKKEEEATAPAEPETPADIALLTEIRDLLAKQQDLGEK